MSIRIATDSGADLESWEYGSLGVELIPIPITIDQRTYMADENFNKNDFYRLLENAEIFPTTSQPSPASFQKAYENARQAGDELIYITLSSALSGTYQSARMIRELEDYDNVYVVDSLSATLGQKLLVLEAVRLRDLGKTAPEIAEALDALKHRICIYAAIDTLEYLYKGGRVSRASAGIGTLARIKPVITVTREGTVQVIGKGLGTAKAMSIVNGLVEKNPPDENYPILGIYSSSTDNMNLLREKAEKALGLKVPDDKCFSLGPVIGAHVGPGVSGFIYIGKETAPEGE